MIETDTQVLQPRQRPPISLGLVLNSYSLLIAVIPIAIVIAIALNLFSTQARDQAKNQLESLAEVKSREIRSWLDTSQTTLRLVLTNPEEYRRMGDILVSAGGSEVTTRRMTSFLEDQLILQSAYDEFYLYNTNGEVRVSTDETQIGNNLQDQPYFESSVDVYQGLLDAGRQLISPDIYPAYYDPDRGTINIIITHPIINETNNVVGVLAGRLSVDALTEIMTTRVGLGDTGETYLVSSEFNNLITPGLFIEQSPTESVSSDGINLGLQQMEGADFYSNYNDEEVIGVYRWLPSLNAALIAEIGESEALEAVSSVRNFSIIVAVITSIVALAIGRAITLWLTRPISKLTEITEAVMQGDYSKRANLPIVTEMGQLGAAFDTMTNDLVRSITERNVRLQQFEELSETLESRVAARTRDLRVAADVARQVTTVLNIDEMLQKVVALTVLNFDLYVCLVYSYDEEKDLLRLAAGVDTYGEQVELGEFKTIRMDAEPSVIAQAARTRQAVVVNNVQESPMFLSTQALPEAQSEVAIPLRLGDRLIGIFDLQSKQPDRFSNDDINVLRTLAEQITIAMHNAQLFTEGEDARAEAEQANRVKSQFLASMSHELRTPLNAILNFTEFVADGVLGDVNDDQVDALNKAIDSGEHLLSLINDILDLTKIEVGMMELFIEEVDINKTLESVLSTIKGIVKDKPQVEIITDIEPELPKIPGDKRRLRQVMLNLISNAVKFTPDGSVTISAHHQDGDIVLSIKDTGVGIPLAEQELVFESFRQSEKGLATGTGTGLGLPISRHLVEAHEGQLWLESEVNVGTTFYVRLPIRQTETPG